MTTITDVLARLETCYDAIPRSGGARVEQIGPWMLFLRDGTGWPYYARPRLGVTTVTAADVAAVRTRQRELGVPEAFEWVHDVCAGVLPAVEAAGLTVHQAPLMVLDPSLLPAPHSFVDSTVDVKLLDPHAPDFVQDYVRSSAVAHVGFAAAGTATGPDGSADRDLAAQALDPAADPALVATVVDGIRTGRTAEAVATTTDLGLAARGALQCAAGAAEVVGVATLPAARHRGLGAAVSALLARRALELGNDIVFLSAASEDVARVYHRIGFRRVGTACIAEAA